MNLRIYLLAVGILINSHHAWSSNKGLYLPLKTDPLIELELEKLATVAQMPYLSKPYKVTDIVEYLDQIKSSHPKLYQRISSYLNRYRGKYGITHADVELSYSTDDNKNIPNQRGRTSESNLKGAVAGYWQLSDNFSVNLGGQVFDGSDGFIPNHTYLSYHNDYLQLDLGYKEIWLSSLQESAMLLSTNAKPIARFALSNPKPFTDFKINYQLSYGKLEEMDGIRFNDTISSGKPGFLSMNVSANLFDWWSIGLNRTMQFGGGNRKIDLGDIWDAIIDPVNSDNCGGQEVCNEAGNQQASIANRLDFDGEMPFSLYLELAGEDSGGFRWYSLGNRAYNIGVFFPYLTDSSSLLFEHQTVRIAWYVHHLYDEGYRNDGNTIGHWWGDEKNFDDGIGARINTIRYNYELNDEYHLDVKFASLKNINFGSPGQFDESIYTRGNELTLGLDQIRNKSVIRYEVYAGKTVLDDDFFRFSVKYTWQ